MNLFKKSVFCILLINFLSLTPIESQSSHCLEKPNFLIIYSTQKLFKHYQTCLAEKKVSIAYEYLFRAYLKSPRDKTLIKEVNQHFLFPTKHFKNKVQSSYASWLYKINLIESLLLFLLSGLFVLLFFHRANILLTFSLFIFIFNLSTFCIKAYTSFFSKYAIVNQQLCQVHSYEDSHVVDLLLKGTIVKVDKTKSDKILIKSQKNISTWIAKQHAWIIY